MDTRLLLLPLYPYAPRCSLSLLDPFTLSLLVAHFSSSFFPTLPRLLLMDPPRPHQHQRHHLSHRHHLILLSRRRLPFFFPLFTLRGWAEEEEEAERRRKKKKKRRSPPTPSQSSSPGSTREAKRRRRRGSSISSYRGGVEGRALLSLSLSPSFPKRPPSLSPRLASLNVACYGGGGGVPTKKGAVESWGERTRGKGKREGVSLLSQQLLRRRHHSSSGKVGGVGPTHGRPTNDQPPSLPNHPNQPPPLYPSNPPRAPHASSFPLLLPNASSPRLPREKAGGGEDALNSLPHPASGEREREAEGTPADGEGVGISNFHDAAATLALLGCERGEGGGQLRGKPILYVGSASPNGASIPPSLPPLPKGFLAQQ